MVNINQVVMLTATQSVTVMNKVKNFAKSRMVTVSLAVEPKHYTVLFVNKCAANIVLTVSVIGILELAMNVKGISMAPVASTTVKKIACIKETFSFAVMQLTVHVYMTVQVGTMAIDVIINAVHAVTHLDVRGDMDGVMMAA